MKAKKCVFKCASDECKDRPPFTSQSNLNRHVNLMHRSEYVCSYENCMEILQSRKDLIFHEKKDHRVKCDLCHSSSRRTFKTNQQLHAHHRLVHERKIKHNVHFCLICKISFTSKAHYKLHQVERHQSGGGDFVLHNTAMSGDHMDFRKDINTDHAPEILFSDEYYPQIIKFLSDQHASLTHLKFNLVLTIIYESPFVENNENDEVVEKSEKSSHDSYRKGKYSMLFLLFTTFLKNTYLLRLFSFI